MTTGGANAQNKPWSVTSRAVAYGALGAALYAGLGMFTDTNPITMTVAIKPALSIIPFVGIRFGAVAGFVTGAVGSAVLHHLHDDGLLSLWNWSFANGLVGLLAGLVGYYVLQQAGPSERVIRVAVTAVVAIVVGFAFTVTDTLMGIPIAYWLTAAYLPAVLNTAVAALLLVPVMDLTWESRTETQPRRPT